jgi:dihydrofolate reductase
MKICMIVATDKDGGIGKDNRLPWSVKEDMRYFRLSTIGKGNNAIVMGRKTHESIGMILPKRENIIITHNTEYVSPVLKCSTLHIGPVIKNNIESVIGHCKERKLDTLWVIGGAEIYNLFMDVTDELYLTKIDYKYKCDTFFPFNFESQFNLRNIEFHSVNDMFDDDKKSIPMEIQHYTKM